MPNPIVTARATRGPYPRLASRTLAANQRIEVSGNNDIVMGAGLDMTCCGWVFTENVGVSGDFFGNYGGGGSRSWIVQHASTSFRMNVSQDGTSGSNSNVVASAFAADTWYFVMGKYDGSNMIISVNDGTVVNTTYTTDIFASNANFGVGRGGSGFFVGKAENFGFWRSARGSGGALSAALITKLYNNGFGMTYRDLTLDLKANLVGWWNLDGNGNDSHGTAHLKPAAGVQWTGGKR